MSSFKIKLKTKQLGLEISEKQLHALVYIVFVNRTSGNYEQA